MKQNTVLSALKTFGLIMVLLAFSGCGGGGGGAASSDSPVQRATLSGTIVFPSATSKLAGTAKAVSATTPSITLVVLDLSGNKIADVPVDSAGTYNVTLPVNNNYVLKATSGLMVLRSLVDQATMATATPTVAVNTNTATAVIAIEKAANLTPGTLGTAAATTVQASSAILKIVAMPPASIVANITNAYSAISNTPATVTASQAQLANLANIVKAAVANSVDAATFVANPTTITTTIYTITGGTVVPTSSIVDATTIANTAAAVANVIIYAPQFTSANSVTFTVGTAGSFAVTTVNASTLSYTGSLPDGVTFTPNGNSGSLGGTAADGKEGNYPLVFTATTDGLTVSQAFVLKINGLNSATFAEGTAGIFTVTGTGTFTKSGTLPAGVTFSSTGVLSGTPEVGTSGTYSITITASNGGLTATQAFTLTVNPRLYSVSGIMTYNGTVARGVSVKLTAASGGAIITAVTDDSGTYQFQLKTGSYTLAPADANWDFTAVSISVNKADVTVPQQSVVPLFTITGKVTLHGTTDGVAKIAVYLKTVQATPVDATATLGVKYNTLIESTTVSPITGVTLDDGTYTFTGVRAGTYSITSTAGTLTSDYGFLIPFGTWRASADVDVVPMQFAFNVTTSEVYLYNAAIGGNNGTTNPNFVYNGEFFYPTNSHTLTLNIDASKKTDMNANTK